ncbi:TAXI family TRAP transporter solute-binding subunit [Caldalkalibacillus uzonensis]|nr:TAXI family TRAP transporter solute-binding subunit [Caldalkalibacillus uzonensis]
MRKTLFPLFLIVLAFALVACSSDTSAPAEGNGSSSEGEASNNNEGNNEGRPDSYNIQMTTGTTTGVYYPLGAAFTEFFTREIDYIQASSQATNGSVQNLNFMQQGESNMALTPIGTLWEAYNGEGPFSGNAYEDVRILAALYPNVNHFVARKDAALTSIADIEGRNFAPGATGSATEIESRQTLEAYGVDYDSVNHNFVGFTEATDLMRNRQVDAAMIMAGIPAAAVSEMTATADGVLLSYDDDIIAKMQEQYPWYIEFIISAESYENQDEDVKTVAQLNMLVVDASMPEEVAYDLVKTFWEKIDQLQDAHAVVAQFDVENAVTGLADVPLHPGAEKYYKEVGVLQ